MSDTINNILGRPKIPLSLNGDISLYLHRLHRRLAADGHTDVLAQIPKTAPVESIEQADTHHCVRIMMGKDRGIVYTYPDDEVVRLSVGTQTSKPVNDTSPAYRSTFACTPPFFWDKDMLKGMKTAMDPRTLALVQFYCLIWAFDEGYYDKDLPVPDYGSLSAAMETLRKTYDYGRVLEKNPHLESYYKEISLERFDVSISNGSDDESVASLFHSPGVGKSPVTSMGSQGFRDAQDDQWIMVRNDSERSHNDGASVSSSGFNDFASHRGSADEDEASLTLSDIIYSAGHNTVEQIRQHISAEKLAVLGNLEDMHFETQDNPKYVLIRLFMGDVKLEQNGVGSIWAFLDARSDGHSEPDITLYLHSHLLRGKSKNFGAKLVVPVFTKDWASRNKVKEYFDLDEIVRRYGAKWGQEIFAIVAYAFLLAAEGKQQSYAAHTVPIYPSFLECLDRYFGRLQGLPTSFWTITQSGTDAAVEKTPTSPSNHSAVFRGVRRVSKPHRVLRRGRLAASSPVLKGRNSSTVIAKARKATRGQKMNPLAKCRGLSKKYLTAEKIKAKCRKIDLKLAAHTKQTAALDVKKKALGLRLAQIEREEAHERNETDEE